MQLLLDLTPELNHKLKIYKAVHKFHNLKLAAIDAISERMKDIENLESINTLTDRNI